MIKKGGKKNCTALAEFTTSRVASDRGASRAFVWYYEGTYYPYFQAPELDWSNINQTYRQCMLLCCDRILYFMRPLFSFTVFFYMGDFVVMSCYSPRWDNLSSGHQQNPLLGIFGKVHVLGSKILFWKNWNIPIYSEERGECIDGFFSFRFIGKKKVPQIYGLFLRGHILEPNLDDFETKSS